MSKHRLIDTNFIVRSMVRDHEAHTATAMELFEICDRGEIQIVVLPIVLAECVFVLQSFYKQTRKDVADKLTQLIGSPGVEIADTRIYLNALARYSESSAHFVDCVIAAHAAWSHTPVATFDQGFRAFPDVTVKLN